MTHSYFKLIAKLIILNQLKLRVLAHRCNTGVLRTPIDFDNGGSVYKQSLPCPNPNSHVRVSGLFKASALASPTEDHVFDIYPGVAVNLISTSGSGVTAYFKFGIFPLFSVNLPSYNSWVFIWFQLRGIKASLAFRGASDFSTQDSNNFFSTMLCKPKI